MAESPVDDRSQGPLRALVRWLKSPASAAHPAGSSAGPPEPAATPSRLGHYAIARKLGQGGMGTVYEARDERLERVVALKTISSLGDDETARRRFWREARAAASVNHPGVCQIYEIGEDGGQLFIAMELLAGSSLAARLEQGPMRLSEALEVVLAVLGALGALHGRGLVHRDLKPSNVFLTPQGVKLLDFGLARQTAETDETSLALTRAGAVVGTPRYMAPEQVLGESVDARTDLFAAGAILFEMLAGRPPFSGRTVVETLHATVYEQPPALAGPPAVAAVDRVIRRALAKRPEQRPASASAMAGDLRAARAVGSDDSGAEVRPLTRLVVLPFRVLRPDSETDFLAFSLPDAITTTVSGHGGVIVRSSAAGARFGGEAPDFKALAVEADVDRVVTGTVLRSGTELRVVAQLIEAPAGTVIASHTVQSTLGDLFRLQDDVARRVVEALSLVAAGPPPGSSAGDAPPNARAYELYLRANELARTYDGIVSARDMYEECLRLDPAFGPAWARLGRCHRVIGKFIQPEAASETRAEDAFRRALELSPRLTVAHKLYANLEADIGHADRAVARLLNEATRHGNDPELFAGLVHACRYCGLNDESMAAHVEARRLDPNIETSVENTKLMAGDPGLLRSDTPDRDASDGNGGMRVIALGLAGRIDESRRALAAMRGSVQVKMFQAWTAHLAAWLDRRPSDMVDHLAPFAALKIFDDPEAVFLQGLLLIDAGDLDRGLRNLERAVSRGYFVAPTLRTSPAFAPLKDTPAFQSLLADAEAGRQRALATFRDAGGERLLGSVGSPR